jgi:hypothetical protein
VRCVDVDAARNGAVSKRIVKAAVTPRQVTVDLSTTDGWQAALPTSRADPLHIGALGIAAAPRGRRARSP